MGHQAQAPIKFPDVTLHKRKVADIGMLLGMNFYVEGVEGSLPK